MGKRPRRTITPDLVCCSPSYAASSAASDSPDDRRSSSFCGPVHPSTLHRAESLIAQSEWAAGWGPSSLAYDIASRPLLRGHDRAWLEDWRRRLDEARLNALECVATASLGIGGTELPQAASCARQLIELAPYRETGHRILMEAFARAGNVAEALRVYDRARIMLRDELGIAPSPPLQDVHRRLLDNPPSSTA
jgi:pentatricopeptide repeat protein